MKTYFILGRRTDIRSVDITLDAESFVPPSPIRKTSQPPCSGRKFQSYKTGKKSSSLPSILDNYATDPLTFQEVKQVVREQQNKDLKEKFKEKRKRFKRLRDSDPSILNREDSDSKPISEVGSCCVPLFKITGG